MTTAYISIHRRIHIATVGYELPSHKNYAGKRIVTSKCGTPLPSESWIGDNEQRVTCLKCKSIA